jgi:putative metallohydrolase (TIGR04338 family)
MSPRDSQRQKVYDAEGAAFAGAPVDLPEMADLERYVNFVCSLKRVKASFPKLVDWPIYIGDGRARRKAGGWRQGILMPRWSRKRWVVLHELSHVIVDRVHSHRRAAGHGWEFASTYLLLVRHVMGVAVHDRLKAEFKARRVRYKAPRQRAPLSAERRAALAATLSRVRALRRTSEVGAIAPAALPPTEENP